jgi:SAM-dependent methyltransferase
VLPLLTQEGLEHFTVTNYFEHQLAAERYAAARPYIHPTALAKFCELSDITVPVDEALDVGCGTGQSSIALTKLARHVVGIDPSEHMLAGCAPHLQVEYKRSAAEQLPVADGAVHLITVAQAFHWLDQDAFLAEARRVLKDAGWLVIYNGWFTGRMKENAAFEKWFVGEYLRHYPTPPRNREPITAENMGARGFSLRSEAAFSNEIRMTVQQFTDYELSTTNVIAATTDSPVLFEAAERWIAESIKPYFDGNESRTFLFSGRIWCLQQ